MAFVQEARSVWDSVGETPLIRLKSLSQITGCEIFAKAEFLNPGCSIKDRAAKGIILDAERRGWLQPGWTIVEGTAGNTGIGLATLAAERGYRVIVSMPDNQAREKFEMLRALGAEVRAFAPCPFSNPAHFYHQAKRIAESQPETFWADQFENPANGNYHYETTGPEIWQQTNGNIDILVLAVGTGGTLSGVSRYLKEKIPSIRVVVADPLGSGLYSWITKGEIKTEGSSITEGIGIMRLTANFKAAKVDEALRINDQEMLEMMIFIAKRDGLFVGTSSALNLRAAYHLGLRYRGTGKRIVTFLCDHGSRYASKILNSDWLKDQNLIPRELPEV